MIRIINLYRLLCTVMLVLILGACEADNPWLTNVKIFKDTPAYELAKAVKRENTYTIKKICTETPELMYVQDPYYFFSVLHWAVAVEKYTSVVTLLEMGMNPNVTTKEYNITPLFLASSYSFVDNDLDTNPKYVRILLQYGADPSIAIEQVVLPEDILVKPHFNLYDDGETPLMRTATPFPTGRLVEKARLLVEMGNANVNQTTIYGQTAATFALSASDINLAHYLIVECGADVTIPCYPNRSQLNILRNRGEEPKASYPVYLLRRNFFPLDSYEHQLKMEVVREFERQGVDYWNEPIPTDILRRIKNQYPDTWEEYIKVY